MIDCPMETKGKGLADTAILALRCAVKNGSDAVDIEKAKERLEMATKHYAARLYWGALKDAQAGLRCLPQSI